MTFKYNKSDEEVRKFDSLVHAVTTIAEPHRMGHDGFVYNATGKVTGMIDTNVDDFLILPGALPAHIQHFSISLGRGDFDIVVYEGATVSANGVEVSAKNTNRVSTNTPGLKMYSAPTVTDVGTLMHTGWVPPTPTGNGQSAAGVVLGGTEEEWILAPSTNYLLRLINNSGSTISYRYDLLWYEIGYEK